ncbi:unnamed protein product [Peniophora sp. CBMAI 1063]|nr:unnamed protein product [Peniophora sp. CBMAI 1063]
MAFPTFNAVACIHARAQGLRTEIDFDRYIDAATHISSPLADLDDVSSPRHGMLFAAESITSTFLSGTGTVLPFPPDDDNIPLNGMNWEKAFDGQNFPSLQHLKMPLMSQSQARVPTFFAPCLKTIYIMGLVALEGSTEGYSYEPSWSRPAFIDGVRLLSALNTFQSLRELRLDDVVFSEVDPIFLENVAQLAHLRRIHVRSVDWKSIRVLVQCLELSSVEDLTIITRIGAEDPTPSWAWYSSVLPFQETLDVVVESSRDFTWVTYGPQRQVPYTPHHYCGLQDEYGLSSNPPEGPNLVISDKGLTRLYSHVPCDGSSVADVMRGLHTSPFLLDLEAVRDLVSKVVLMGLCSRSRSGIWTLLCTGDDWRFMQLFKSLQELHVVDERAVWSIVHLAAPLNKLILYATSSWSGSSAIGQLLPLLRSIPESAPLELVLRGVKRPTDTAHLSRIKDYLKPRPVVDNRNCTAAQEADSVRGVL